MKNKLMIVIVTGLLMQFNNTCAVGVAPFVDNTFNYQGELTNGDTVLNGVYDMRIEAYTTDSGVDTLGDLFEIIKVPVIDGIFTINDVDLGDIFDARVVYLQISVRENGTGASYEDLFPRLKIKSVPYANKLITGNAQNGQVLTVVEGEWVAGDLPVVVPATTPWITSGIDIKYDDGNVGIGNATIASSGAKFNVTGDGPHNASFDGLENSLVVFRESGALRAIFGSGNNYGANDFAISTPTGGTGKLHLASRGSSVLTVTPEEFIGIGTSVPTSTLHVKTNDLLSAQFDGGEGSLITILEQGVIRASLGSGTNVADEDFSITTVTGSLHLTSGIASDPSISIRQNGDVGVNTISPLADLHVEGTTGGDLFRVRINQATKFRVRENGGTTIGTTTNPPDNGLYVSGDVKQPVNSNGMMKYMVSINVCGRSFVNIDKSYNGIDNAVITVANDPLGAGTCLISFSQNILNRFFMAHITTGFSADGATVSCNTFDATTLSCTVFDETGAEAPGQFDLFVF